ncbi:Ger(x)C family spore germination protein [Alkalihalobacillus pseudalcaliphilus]|uniref:Ger(x)C family spore germination protein n=1 Tax=Alkalihalobacillus pseudalcaliphilus TaxID=79884 RepID=UPI00064D9B71|nr:Ger(x)C family spore germination protein [Alkalihalobacillus pseudalcaliphilus]KMK76025.1 hypothetical protein AB990_12380 [Alkalihalobacillus pseudalcaliphilus]
MKHKFLSILLFMQLSGCVQTQIIDEVQHIHSAGFDYLSDDAVEVTISVPLYRTENVLMSDTLSAVAATSRAARIKLNNQSPKRLHSGKLKSLLVNIELAEKEGILSILDAFTRDPTIGLQNKICIVEGTVNDLLSSKYEHEEEVSTYIEELLRHNMEAQNIPKTNLYIFLNQYYGLGQDPYLPILRKHNNSIELSGIALLRGDRYVEKINVSDSFLLKLLCQPFNHGEYEIELREQDEYAMIRNVNAKPSYQIEKNTNKPQIDIHLKMSVQVIEYSGNEISDEKLNEIHTQFKQDIREQSQALFQKLQQLHVDPIGLGGKVQAHNPHFIFEEWDDYYMNELIISIHPDITFLDKGVKK